MRQVSCMESSSLAWSSASLWSSKSQKSDHNEQLHATFVCMLIKGCAAIVPTPVWQHKQDLCCHLANSCNLYKICLWFKRTLDTFIALEEVIFKRVHELIQSCINSWTAFAETILKSTCLSEDQHKESSNVLYTSCMMLVEVLVTVKKAPEVEEDNLLHKNRSRFSGNLYPYQCLLTFVLITPSPGYIVNLIDQCQKTQKRSIDT